MKEANGKIKLMADEFHEFLKSRCADKEGSDVVIPIIAAAGVLGQLTASCEPPESKSMLFKDIICTFALNFITKEAAEKEPTNE